MADRPGLNSLRLLRKEAWKQISCNSSVERTPRAARLAVRYSATYIRVQISEETKIAALRKVANLLALAVLSTVFQRPMHRYEMASIMRARGKEQDMDIKWGSLYTVVDNLAKHGFLEKAGNTRQGARPERTVYRITEAGKRELLDWTRELLSTVDAEHPRFAAGLSVLSALPPNEVIELLQIRLDSLNASIADLRSGLGQAGGQIPRLFLIENEYRVAIVTAEAAWVRSLLDELASGTYPDLDRWRAWHQTGEMPTDLAELAERGSVMD